LNKTSHYSYRYKILFIASWYDESPMAYAGSYIYDQAFKLSILGHEVHILFLDKSFKRFPFRTHSSFKNIFVHSISCPYPMHRIVGFYFPFLLDLHLRYFAKIIIPDVIHAHGVRPAGILANRFVRFHKAPIVITEHSGPLKSFWKSIHGYKQIENA
jgi:glycosyltransferase involved in cell wall biosynthesis